jgi:ubiquinone biosynthesis protein UbiJ
MSARAVIASVMERAINAYLAMDPEMAAGLGRIAGRHIALELIGTGLDFCVVPGAGCVQVSAMGCETEPDTAISATPWALAGLGLGHERNTPLFEGEVRIRGDMDVGSEFARVLKSVEIDWEELLARVVGDISAHEIGNLLREVGGWARRTGDALRMDVSEYLQEEARVVPTRIELESFLDEVDTLRSDVDRLEARVRRLEARTGERPVASPGEEPQDPAGG